MADVPLPASKKPDVTRCLAGPDHPENVCLAQAADERNPSQFIVTTFHPQIIQQADKIYGVSHSHRISR